MNWQEGASPADRALNAEQEQENRLAAQARAGAEWALTALIARYQPSVARYLTRLTGNPDLARSLAERIFLRMERRLHGPHGAEQLRLWLLRACTEAGLDALRRPKRKKTPPRLQPPSPPRALLTERTGVEPVRRLLSGWGRLKQVTNTTGRQVRQLIWTIRAEATGQQAWDTDEQQFSSDPRGASSLGDASELNEPLEDELDTLDPREELRHRLVRVVLAELPYGDAQCLALHLVAGLNQAEVARALGLTASATRRRIVHGLQAFSTRYAAAIANLGIPAELGFQGHATASAAVEQSDAYPPDRSTLLPPVAASVPSAPYGALLDGDTLSGYTNPPMTDIEQEPTMRLWPPLTVTPAPLPSAPEPFEAGEPSQPVEAVETYDTYGAYEANGEPGAATPTDAPNAWEEAEQWDEADDWGDWEQADTQATPMQASDSPDAAHDWDAFGAEAPDRPDMPDMQEPSPLATHATEATAETAETLADVAESAVPAAMQPGNQSDLDDVEEAEQPGELIPDEVEDGSITQPSLQRIARQAAIEEARRQLAANAGNVERNGALTSLAHDAVVWPVVDALPVAPAASSARASASPNIMGKTQTSAESGPLSYEVSEVSSLGTVEVAVEQEGYTQRESDVALGFETPTDSAQQEYGRGD